MSTTPPTQTAAQAVQPAPQPLARLAPGAGDLLVSIEGGADPTISGLSNDSRTVRAGDLFFCVPGTVTDGHRFGRAAAAAGAAALCVERVVDAAVPQIVVRDVRRAAGRIAAGFFGHPAASLSLLGVTGTNGKTTTAFLLAGVLEAASRTTGLIGTIETRIAGRSRPGVRTTPDSLDLQRLLAEMVAAGVTSVAMEVTSHALALHRVEGLRFAAAGFTNLSQDHLDFHADMEDYFLAKKSLFTPERAAAGAANLDDPYGRRLAEGVDIPCIGYGRSAEAEVRAEDVRLDAWGSRFRTVTPAGTIEVSTALVGPFNVYNCLAAAAVAVQAGIPLDAVARGIAGVKAVPGRFESIDAGQPFSVIVDYAHTPDSLDNVLRAARPLVAGGSGRILCVFGCGGDRDRGKRPLMGAVVARLADVAIVSSDNPRSEDPTEIIDQILEGVVAERPDGPDRVLVDRREAIREAIDLAREGDVVVIAGKGHETGQEFADRTIAFDDRVEARAALVAAGWGEGP